MLSGYVTYVAIWYIHDDYKFSHIGTLCGYVTMSGCILYFYQT